MVRDLFQLNTFYKKTIAGLCLILVGMIAMYGVLEFQTYARIVAQETLEQNMVDVSASVSTLESDYMRRMGLLTLDEAHLRGFIDTDVSFFVSRQAQTLTLHDRAY
ncbi:MAG: hypothetical protein NUW02_00245 [Candidatus Campbellbacteria bacterium]|nr:hypothetical protein [Candidatus Campbellbacteria bacterium]